MSETYISSLQDLQNISVSYIKPSRSTTFQSMSDSTIAILLALGKVVALTQEDGLITTN